jgi:hypothetical protein
VSADRKLDGEISRALEGKTVAGVAKDGLSMAIFCSNGEQWVVAWADFIKGVGFQGEPAIVAVDNMRLAAGEVSTPDGSVHAALLGRTIESARTDGELLMLQCTDGRRYGIAWVNPDTHERIKAEPCLVKINVALRMEGVSAVGDARM